MFNSEMHQKGILWVASVGALGLAVGLSGGYAWGVHTEISSLTPFISKITGADALPPSAVDFAPVWKAWHVIDEKYVPSNQNQLATSTASTTPEKQTQERVWGMISGLAASLNDPYTFFLPPVESQQFQEDINGSFEGVGMEIAVKDGVLTVISPLKGTPAERAGVHAGDRLLKIDGVDTRGMDVSAAIAKIRGPRGTQVVFTIGRAGLTEPVTIKVTRDVINIPIVTTTKRPDGVFDIQLLSFSATSPNLFRNALREFVESGDTKLILDLRGNPGGYLEAAVDMASWFLPSGKVIVTEDYDGHGSSLPHRSLGYDVFNENLKMVIIVDKGSASASEILADALHFYGVAKMVGVNTFGKGSVQELINITPDTALKVTVARWLGPDGKQIPLTGITPDIEVKMTDEDVKAGRDPQLEKAVQILTNQ